MNDYTNTGVQYMSGRKTEQVYTSSLSVASAGTNFNFAGQSIN